MHQFKSGASWKTKRVIQLLQDARRNYQITFGDEERIPDDILVFDELPAGLVKDIERICAFAVVSMEEMSILKAKRQLHGHVQIALELGDYQTPFFFKMIEEGYAPPSWVNPGEEILYAEEHEKDGTQFILYYRAANATETTAKKDQAQAQVRTHVGTGSDADGNAGKDSGD